MKFNKTTGLSKSLWLGLMLLATPVSAQINSWHVTAVGEQQWNSDNGRWNLSTMLDYGMDLRLWRGSELNMSALTTYMQHDEDYLSVDPIVFSNVDALSRLFRLSIFGLSQQIGPVKVFAGIRSTMTDYFADDELGYFIYSIHGIQPAVTENFDIATYPTAALALHAQWQIDDAWRLTTTFYNGHSGDRIEDAIKLGGGVINMTAVNYHVEQRTAELGMSVGHDDRHKQSSAVYGYDIERLTPQLSVMGELGYYFGSKKSDSDEGPATCVMNGVLGGIYALNEHNSIGVAATYARYDQHIDDTQIELNYAYETGPLTVQPVMIFDNNDGNFQTIGALRFTLSWGK